MKYVYLMMFPREKKFLKMLYKLESIILVYVLVIFLSNHSNLDSLYYTFI